MKDKEEVGKMEYGPHLIRLLHELGEEFLFVKYSFHSI